MAEKLKVSSKNEDAGANINGSSGNTSEQKFNFNKFIPSDQNEYRTVLTPDQNAYLDFLRSKMIIHRDRDKWQSSYNFMQFTNPYHLINGTREYIFFTKPNLNILQDATSLNPTIANNAFWKEMLEYYRDDLACLQKGKKCQRTGVEGKIDAHPFIPLLSNSVASTLSLPSIDADTIDTPATIYGTSIQYRGDSLKSDEGYDFNLEFVDNKALEVYYFFKIWDEYEKLKKIGVIEPPRMDDGGDDYRVYRILHDQIAIYRFLVDADDMSSIIHYAKFVGCFPKSVPRDSFDSLEGEIKYSVSWHSQWVEDSNPMILAEFNAVCRKYFGGLPNSEKIVDLYDKDIDAVNGNWRTHPYITINPNYGNNRKVGAKYQLCWYDK